MSDIDPRFTFDNFVVGPANRLASAAARRAADSPGKSYNPLFVYAPSGLGKSHILGAIAHRVERAAPGCRVRYQTLERYLEDLAAAIQAGARDRLKDEYRDLDILLLDDVQFLAGQPEAQEMILATLDGLTGSGSQIVLASDRPPAEINGLDARLVSRFSGGLIVDIAPPEYETRVAIIRRKVDEQEQSLEPGVAEALARIRFRNVRELSGALNRILAVQDLEGRRLLPGDVQPLVGRGRDREEDGAEVDEALGTFLSEVAGSVADKTRAQEEPWRQTIRSVAEAAEREGFVTRRLRGLIQAESAPPDWGEQVEAFKRSLARLREIEAELHGLRNPWPEAAATLVKDPDRLEEAEAFLQSVVERTRPFPALGPGPVLAELEGAYPVLVLKAAEQLATAERPQYNPLFVWSPRAEVARGLLAATGRTFARVFPDARVAAASLESFSQDFIRALSEGVAGAWRERWWTVDLLLLDGAQALGETERAQDEFFHLFEALKRRGARVLLTSDRPPHQLKGIDERLRSRFEGGLVLEVEATEVPAGSERLVLVEGEPASQPESPLPPAAGLEDAPHRMGPEDSGWLPTREEVVWIWPQMEGRLVEELQ
ncbi:MAG: DnaA/Hda family protein [Longimicrobiales bacterium]|nr:DnaA/Hda family protein [Longimicrobiales bacterium]